jgi:hypothetical protein
MAIINNPLTGFSDSLRRAISSVSAPLNTMQYASAPAAFKPIKGSAVDTGFNVTNNFATANAGSFAPIQVSSFEPEPIRTDAYDLRRQQAEADSAAEAERATEALKRRLGMQGMTSGSGMMEKQQQILDVENRKALANRLGAVDVAEADAANAAKEAEKARQFQMSYGKEMAALGDTFSQAAETRKLETEAAHAQGLADAKTGTPLTEKPADWSNNKWIAYQAGVSGKALEDISREQTFKDKYYAAAIAQLDIKSPSFQQDLNYIFGQMENREDIDPSKLTLAETTEETNKKAWDKKAKQLESEAAGATKKVTAQPTKSIFDSFFSLFD